MTGITNTNSETGIRYGTIYLRSIDDDTAHYLFYEGNNVSMDDAAEELRREIGIEAAERGFDDDTDREDWEEREFERQVEGIEVEEPTIEGECDGVKYMISWLGGVPLLWVFESPVTGRFNLCSPCVPNACNLDSPNPGGYEGYMVPADWLKELI